MNDWKTHLETPEHENDCIAMGSFLAPVRWNKEAGKWVIDSMDDVRIVVNFWKEKDERKEEGRSEGSA